MNLHPSFNFLINTFALYSFIAFLGEVVLISLFLNILPTEPYDYTLFTGFLPIQMILLAGLVGLIAAMANYFLNQFYSQSHNKPS